jgi:hypothetical protein
LSVVAVCLARLISSHTLGGLISDKKGCNIPSGGISLNVITPKDERDLKLIAELDPEWVAASFIGTAQARFLRPSSSPSPSPSSCSSFFFFRLLLLLLLPLPSSSSVFFFFFFYFFFLFLFLNSSYFFSVLLRLFTC